MAPFSKFFQLRHVLCVVLFTTFVLTTLVTKEQMSNHHRHEFQKIIANHTVMLVNQKIAVGAASKVISGKNGTWPGLKYAKRGALLNCLQRPLADPRNFDQDLVLNMSAKKFAYVWYVTRPAYLCSAVAAMKHLSEIRKRQGNGIHLDADYVLIFSPENFQHVANSAKANRTRNMFDAWQREGGKLREFDALSANLTDKYYKGCYEKLYAFKMTDYDRVIVMDSDGIAVNNLDHLFLLKMPEGIQIAAPQGYWFKRDGIVPGTIECQAHPTAGMVGVISSVLLLVAPNANLFERSKKYFGLWMKWVGHEYFDMDILNQEFSCQREVLVLPKMYGTLDSEYFNGHSKLSFRFSMCKNFSEVQYLHFSGQGKPWTSAELHMDNFLARYNDETKEVVERWFFHAQATCPWLVPNFPQ